VALNKKYIDTMQCETVIGNDQMI